MGTVLLTVAVITFWLAARAAATLRRRLPSPTCQLGPQDREAGWTRIARWAVAAMCVVMILAAAGLVLSVKSPLPRNGEELAASRNPANEFGSTGNAPRLQSGGDQKRQAVARQLPTDVAAEPPPSDEDIAKAWPRFRGPGGLGISAYTNVPDAWDAANRARASCGKRPCRCRATIRRWSGASECFSPGAD